MSLDSTPPSTLGLLINVVNGIETKYDTFAHAGRTFGNANKAANIKHAIDMGSVAYGCRWRYA